MTEENRIKSPRMVKLSSIFEICIVAAITFTLLEITSWWWFHNMMPSNLRDSALFTVYGKELPEDSEVGIPMIQPYIWANYKPNSMSPAANEFGWRYGGGPKQQGVFRILCLGGSTTWSSSATSADRSYPARLEKYLKSKGYSVDVVNGGAPYFTSAELVGTLAFRGIYTSPDLVLIHTGGNDTGPFMSPREYRSDYTHWRTVDPSISESTNLDFFRVMWNFPSWTSRLFFTYYLHPNALYQRMVGKQLTSPQDGMFADNDISNREPTGLKKNLRSLIAISNSNGAKVVSITFNIQFNKYWDFLPQAERRKLAFDPQLSKRVVNRLKFSIDKSNDATRQISAEYSVPVIPFDSFQTSSPEYWHDHNHLTDEGVNEKAIFIGDFLIKNNIIPMVDS